MKFRKVTNWSENIPQEVYVGFIRSLYANPSVLLIGALSHFIVAVLVYLENHNPAFLAMGPIMASTGLYRYFSIRRVDPAEIKTYEDAARHERRYLIDGSIAGLAIGTFGFMCTYLSHTTFSTTAALSMLMGSALTVSGRNYGSSKMVMIFTITMFGPATIGLLINGQPFGFALGLLVIPFMIILLQMAKVVRLSLFTAITEELRARYLAQRFNRALNTMPQGLLMLDTEGRIIVANAEAAELIRVSSPSMLVGRSMKAVLSRIVASGLMDAEQGRYAVAQLTKALTEGFDRKLIVGLTDGRHFELSAREGDHNLGVVLFQDVTSRVRSDQKISTMARFDTLTGLPNRAHFHEQVVERLALGDPRRNVALAIVDLDDFKAVNDSLGHPVGDEVIKAIAGRLSPIISKDIIVGRFGGDEFVIYCDDLEDALLLGSLLDNLNARLQGPLEVAGNRLRIQASIGAVISRPNEQDVDAMIVKADLALSRSKGTGKNTWSLFKEEMDEAFRSRQRLKDDLRAAIESKTLRIVYQPIVSLAKMRIESCEALCRWDHPELGPISPAVFIPLAEEMGVISEITTLALQSACAECKKWPSHIQVSVNLSAKDFRDDDIVAKVRAALSLSGLPANRLEIEVTETALLDDKSLAIRYVEQLRELGVHIALDDFGTGYSSLSYLHRLPLDKIKIDRSFLADVGENTRSLHLLTDIVKLCRRLGLTVTIEGVETFEQLKILSQHVKPEFAQGFLFGAPLTASGIETMSTTSWPFAKDIRSNARTTVGG